MSSKEIVAITGAGSGLGKSLAIKYAEMGYHVCLLGRTKATLMETASQCNNSASIYELDITNSPSIDEVIGKILNEHGKIDYWINNAGVGVFKPVLDLSEDDIHQMIDINLTGTILCTHRALKAMVDQNKGCIVNVVSNSGKVAKETESVYSASKFGVRGFSESIALEYQDSGIHIFSAYMGNMKTNLWGSSLPKEQLARYTDSKEVADLIFESTKTRQNLTKENITVVHHGSSLSELYDF